MRQFKILIILAITLFAACSDREDFDDLASVDYKYVGIVPQQVPGGGQVFEGTGSSTASIEIPLFYYLGSNPSATDITITASGATLGADFNIPEAKSVNGQSFTITLPADTTATSFTLVPVANDVQNENKVLNLVITGLPDNVYAGAPVKASQEITILDDDCPYGFDSFVGTASVIENGSVGPYAVNSVEIAPNTIQVDNFWDSGIQAFFVLVPCDGTVQVPLQSTPAFGDPDGTIQGSGTWDDQTNELVVNVTITFPLYEFVSNEQHVYSF